jgi:hypothetical protein
MHSNVKALALIWTTMFLGTVAAQTSTDSAEPNRIFVSAGGLALQSKAGMIGLRVESMMDAAPIKGAPFCATLTTERTQVFADGNRIHSADDSTLCRDSAGRTRREAGLNLLGAMPQKSPPKLTTIVDPVAGVRYVLNTDEKIAHKMPASPPPPPPPPGLVPGGVATTGPIGFGPRGGVGEPTVTYDTASGASDVFFYKKTGPDSAEPAPTTENLGDQTIGGIHTIGTRVTTTIPSGSMGNEQPIFVISESWYSPELKTTVMTKHSDPWAGELKTQFTNVNTAEPDRSLFVIPSDYKVMDDKAGPFFRTPMPSSSLPSPSTQ